MNVELLYDIMDIMQVRQFDSQCMLIVTRMYI